MNYFARQTAARPYAHGRPYFHPLVVHKLQDVLQPHEPIPRALDQARHEVSYIFMQADEALSRTHSVQVAGFYKLRSNWHWDFVSWERLMWSHINRRTAEKAFLL